MVSINLPMTDKFLQIILAQLFSILYILSEEHAR